MRNIVSVCFFTFLLVFLVSSVYAYEFVSPQKGEGPVQIAERIGVSPKKFIALNLKLGNFKYPKRVSLIYTWQKFAIPVFKAKSSHKRVESILPESKKGKEKEIGKVAEVKKVEKLDKTEKKERIREQVVKNDSELDKEIANVMSMISADQRGVKKEVVPQKNFLNFKKKPLFLLAVLGVICLIALWFSKRFSKKNTQQFHRTSVGLALEKKKQAEVFEIEKLIPAIIQQEYALPTLPTGLENLKLGDEERGELFFVALARDTGRFVVVHGESCYISPHEGAQGLEDTFRFLVETYECELLKKITFKVPFHLSSQYASIHRIISRKRRIFELCDQRNQLAAYRRRSSL